MENRSAPPWRARPPQPRANAPSQSIPRKRPAEPDQDTFLRDEEDFVLRQAKRKAAIRVKSNRAKPIDWLAVTLRATEPAHNERGDDEDEDQDVEIADPEAILGGLDSADLAELEKDVETYLTLEKSKSNVDFWQAIRIICSDRLQKTRTAAPGARGVSSVSADVDRLLAPKTYDQLETLEKQIRSKLNSNESIDVDYWEHLLRSLIVWKAKAKLRKISQSITKSKLDALRKQQRDEAVQAVSKLQTMLGSSEHAISESEEQHTDAGGHGDGHATLDPEPLLKLPSDDKVLGHVEEKAWLEKITEERQKVLKMGYVPLRNQVSENASLHSVGLAGQTAILQSGKPAADETSSASALYDREVARGVNEDEEIFAGEEDVTTVGKQQWANKHRPRKPRYFNRVQMGYEWNKYNQTHYDHDNPPPKVVQGYKFNIFYPDLIDKTKAPTYRIERENGRKRGQSFAPAGEDDTCLIRFVAGPPYEDIAFRIVDKEWDYSAKRERGFKSSFDKGILQLHFQFKKIYYRK